MAGFNAIGTNHLFFNPTVGNGPHFLQVWIKSALGLIMRMADIMSDHWFFTADFTYF
jgi:hypothetical protein